MANVALVGHNTFVGNTADATFNINAAGDNLLALVMSSAHEAITSQTIGGVEVTNITNQAFQRCGYLCIPAGNLAYHSYLAGANWHALYAIVFSNVAGGNFRKPPTIATGAAANPSIAVPSGCTPRDLVASLCGHKDDSTTAVSHTLIDMGLRAATQYTTYTGGGNFTFTCAGPTAWTVVAAIVMGSGGGAMWWFSSRKWKHFLEDLKRGLLPPDVLKRRWGEVLRPI